MTNDNSPADVPSSLWHRAEFICPIVVLFLHGLYYNTIGEIASRRGVDFGPLLMTPLDRIIPFSVVFIIPYTAIWFLPIAMLVLLRRQPDFTAGKMRRITLAFVVLILVCYALWIALPTNFSERVDESVLQAQGILGSLTLLTYHNASVWNACPSFHVATPWFICRILKQYTGRVPLAVRGLTVAIMMATLGIRIHFIADVFGGVLIAETIYRLVLPRLEREKALENIPGPSMIGLYASGIAVALLCHQLVRAALVG